MFIQVIQAKCSRPEELRAYGSSWKSELGAGAHGWLGSTFGVTDGGEFLGVVRFDSRASANANSARPEQGAWAEKLGTFFDEPPSFTDYDDVTTFLDGGSDSAGFVQVIRGQVSDVARAKSALGATADVLRSMRPEIIGGTFAVGGDGTFTQTVAFTNEASARTGEQLEAPPEIGDVVDDLMSGASFFDLRRPWFETPD